MKRFLDFALILMLLIPLAYSKSAKISKSDLEEKANILDKTIAIFDAIKESDMYKTGKAISKWGLPLLEAIGSFANVIMSNFESDSKELTYMKEQFKIINEKMDNVDREFNEVKNLMDWNVIKIQYGSYELNSQILISEINSIVDYPPSIRQIAIEKFLLSYEHLYKNSAENIYQGFVNPHKIFSDNLILAIRKYTKDYRHKIEKFFAGNIQLILKCLEIESFYMNLKNFTNLETLWQSQWKEKLNNLTQTMNIVIEQVVKNWEQTSKNDIEEFNVENTKLSHKEYAEQLYGFLNLKFPNRSWRVLVYEPLDSDTDHKLHVCFGITQMNSRGRNVAVSSVPVNSGSFDPKQITATCKEIPENIGSWGRGPASYVMVMFLMPKVNCNTNQIVAVIRSKSRKYYHAPPGRSAVCRWAGYYNRVVNIHKTFDLIVLG